MIVTIFEFKIDDMDSYLSFISWSSRKEQRIYRVGSLDCCNQIVGSYQ